MSSPNITKFGPRNSEDHPEGLGPPRNGPRKLVESSTT